MAGRTGAPGVLVLFGIVALGLGSGAAYFHYKQPLLAAELPAGVLGLGFAGYLASKVMSAPAGSEKMQKIAKAIQEGAKAFLFTEYKWLAIYVGIVAALLLFSSPLLRLLGGGGYLDSLHLQKSIVLVVAAYIFFLPFDRYSGVGLMAIDRPRLNFKKIVMMLLANVLFDLIAIFVFHSLILVATATLIFTLAGIGLGLYYLQRESGFQLKELPGMTAGHIQYIYNEIKNQMHGRTIPVS